MLDSRVLVLNQNYEPMWVTSARRAVVLIFREKAEIVEHNHAVVRSANTSMPLPSIVRLSRYIRVPQRRVMFSRKNVMRRDRQQCQYCGATHGDMTVDHVIPKVRGGQETWENLVCACMPCNTKKGDRTPKEAGMPLLKKPRRPGYLFYIQHLARSVDDRWRPYLYMDEE